MPEITYFYRYPNPIYFSIEGLFDAISTGIATRDAAEFTVRKKSMPFPSSLSNIIRNIAFSRREQSAINHITGDIYYAVLGFSKRHINLLTVHDCVALHKYPRTNPRHWLIKWIWYDLPVRKADLVTVISESSAAELIRFTGCPREKIRVIPNFIDPAFRFEPARNASGKASGKAVILFIGTTPNKNLDRLMEAVQGLPVHLEIIGFLDSAQTGRLDSLGISYRQSSGLSKEELLTRYRDCDLLAFPSTYEGFGLPILEAQAVGRPVLTSDRSPMKEVAGLGACLVDPEDIASIRRGLLAILQDTAFREELVRSGQENVKAYSREKVIQAYADVYRLLMDKKKTG